MDTVVADREQFSSRSTKYEIEADWTLTKACNYTCKYCFYPTCKRKPPVGRISPEEHLEFFNSTGRTWLFHLTGGEPFLYRDFVRFCQVLTSQHYICINSNLSSKRVRVFASEVDASRVEYIHCGVHVEERDSRKGWQDLEANVTSLLKHGFPVFASLVMTPSAFADFQRVEDMFAGLGVSLIPKAIRGAYNNRWYPQAYTKSERDKFRRLSEQAEVTAKTRIWNLEDMRPTVNPLLDRQHLDGIPNFTGVQCSAGSQFVSIDCEGIIRRCGYMTVLGNIPERRLELLSTDRPCNDWYCPYPCLRYSRFEKEATNLRRYGTPIKFKPPFVMIRAAVKKVLNRLNRFSKPER